MAHFLCYLPHEGLAIGCSKSISPLFHITLDGKWQAMGVNHQALLWIEGHQNMAMHTDLSIAYGCFFEKMAELKSGGRIRMACKGWNIHYLEHYRKIWPSSTTLKSLRFHLVLHQEGCGKERGRERNRKRQREKEEGESENQGVVQVQVTWCPKWARILHTYISLKGLELSFIGVSLGWPG